MRIAIDAMGGDNAPDDIVAGVIQAHQLVGTDDQLILVGPKALLDEQLKAAGQNRSAIQIVDASEVIDMDEPPIEALRKKRKSSIAVMAKMASQGEAQAVISAGNTGACVAALQMRMRSLTGVNRPGIAVVFPTFEGPVTMCDVGANIACKPINLYQYAVMAAIYATQLYNIDNPKVGLMSIGEEDAKGNEIVKKAREFIKSDSNLNFVGNIEGRDIFKGVCDVAICDGFVGNVVLKLTEGLVDGLFKAIKFELFQTDPKLASDFNPIISNIYKKYDYNEYGGALLLGVNGTAIVCHGSSKSNTIKNAILTAKKLHTRKINQQIIDHLEKTSVRSCDE
jgi:glycerol-3-phosphate acyltransferase PlsX